ncbi:DUF6629 family protein [Rhodonellum sp.]|uniref:DUF6629 family protein n=1 Tax=Rhodonellum sp. TaxID=2231180 RepID=UPI0027275368|nr:DUF6629 family protein [Rhodonellum sp.]MDO9554787.1 hypothetical protein [Rhodonellum sp.]
MCFSAEASFGASIVLGSIGAIAVSKVKTRSQFAFAAIPLMFAFQQLSEGILWIALSAPSHSSWSHWSALIFLGFAQVVWPVWIPVSIFLLETNRLKKMVLGGFMAMGFTVALYLLYSIQEYGFSAEIRGDHIKYTLDFSKSLVTWSAVFYFIPIVFSPFVSSTKGMPLLGLANLFSFLLAELYFEDHLISVWCFFAALLSVMVLGVIIKMNAKKNRPEG